MYSNIIVKQYLLPPKCQRAFETYFHQLHKKELIRDETIRESKLLVQYPNSNKSLGKRHKSGWYPSSGIPLSNFNIAFAICNRLIELDKRSFNAKAIMPLTTANYKILSLCRNVSRLATTTDAVAKRKQRKGSEVNALIKQDLMLVDSKVKSRIAYKFQGPSSFTDMLKTLTACRNDYSGATTNPEVNALIKEDLMLVNRNVKSRIAYKSEYPKLHWPAYKKNYSINVQKDYQERLRKKEFQNKIPKVVPNTGSIDVRKREPKSDRSNLKPNRPTALKHDSLQLARMKAINSKANVDAAKQRSVTLPYSTRKIYRDYKPKCHKRICRDVAPKVGSFIGRHQEPQLYRKNSKPNTTTALELESLQSSLMTAMESGADIDQVKQRSETIISPKRKSNDGYTTKCQKRICKGVVHFNVDRPGTESNQINSKKELSTALEHDSLQSSLMIAMKSGANGDLKKDQAATVTYPKRRIHRDYAPFQIKDMTSNVISAHQLSQPQDKLSKQLASVDSLGVLNTKNISTDQNQIEMPSTNADKVVSRYNRNSFYYGRKRKLH